MNGLLHLAPLLELPGAPPLPPELLDITDRIRLLENGLPIDWLIRAQQVHNIEHMIYLCKLQDRWANEDLKVIASILKEHERSGGGILDINDPPEVHRTKSPDSSDDPEIYSFICRLLKLVRQESVIWDREGDPNFGYHQPMRQAWCNISFKLGGWGTMKHVQMLKSIYRKKREQYYTEYMRKNNQFQYYSAMEFLNGVLDMSNNIATSKIIPINSYVDATCSDINYSQEIKCAPEEVKMTLGKCEDFMDEIETRFGNEALSEFLSLCCNEVIQSREDIVQTGLRDNEWTISMDKDYDVFEEDAEMDVNHDAKSSNGNFEVSSQESIDKCS